MSDLDHFVPFNAIIKIIEVTVVPPLGVVQHTYFPWLKVVYIKNRTLINKNRLFIFLIREAAF